MNETGTQVVAVRVSKRTYDVLVHKSKTWEMSISSLIREVIVKIFAEDDQTKIKTYRRRRRKNGNLG